MRTRSQPMSPGGFFALEKEKNAPRQTRSMRARSASHASAQSNSQSETEEPQPQPTTRSRTNKKTTTTTGAKKDTATKKTTTTRKTATTKRAAAARKTDTTAKPSSKPAKAPATRATKTRAERKTTRRTAEQSPEEESQEIHDASQSPEVKAEPDTTANESPKIPDENNEESQKPTEVTSSAVDVLSEPQASDLNRKRPRAESPDRVSETPSVKRSRTLRPPGSTSLARRLAPLSRRLSTNGVPYAERLRRRQAERQGRIHTTVFRLPELVAQTEADRRASESASPSPAPPAPHNSFDFPESSEPSRSMEESTPQEPRTPETPRGWNIRGLLSSVPRFSVSRFLPRLGRSFGRTEEGEEIDPETASRQSTPSAPSTPTKTTAAPTQPPATERVVTTEQWKAPGGSTPKSAPAKKPLPNLSYDLFPRPINRDLYLPRSPEPAAEAKDAEDSAANKDQLQEQEKQAQVSPETAPAEARGREITDTTDKKRKRAPSPDVIPNPPGCSYGLDLDYFCYSDSEEEEPSPSVSKPTPLAKSAVRSALRSETHPSKKVRFDASPEDTPSKKRGRATDPYQGHHFLGLGDVSPTPATDSAKTTPATPTVTGSPVQRPPGFKFNTQGSFGFDYDDFSDDSSSSGASTPAILSPASTLPETRATPRSQVQESLQSPRPAPRAAPSAPPSTPKVDAEALAKVRSQAEKYKPKTPSGLRTASRYSTSPMVQSPNVEPLKKPEPKESIPEELPEKENVPEKPIEKPAEKFGDDQFARDAEWLYERCPSGNFSKFTWPEKRSLVDSLEINPEAVKILDNVWDSSDIEVGHTAFRRGMEEFAATFV